MLLLFFFVCSHTILELAYLFIGHLMWRKHFIRIAKRNECEIFMVLLQPNTLSDCILSTLFVYMQQYCNIMQNHFTADVHHVLQCEKREKHYFSVTIFSHVNFMYSQTSFHIDLFCIWLF